MFNKNLHLIEPTLTGLSGHEYEYVANLLNANKNFNFNVKLWIGKKAKDTDIISKLLNINKKSLKVNKYFIRPIRQIQKIFLYYKLLKNNQLFYVCTSGIIDLIICDFLVKLINLFKNFNNYLNKNNLNNNLNYNLNKNNLNLDPKKYIAFFHFHQFNSSANKIARLNKIAVNSQNNFKIFSTTPKLAQIFLDCNFRNVKAINYPSINPNLNLNPNIKFNKVLYAGVARSDKGFSLVVDTILHMQTDHKHLPFVVQISPPNSNRYDAKTLKSLAALQKISHINYKIKLCKFSLTVQLYQELFIGAICLLVYDQKQFADRVSGVTLDAFYSGCPIITVSDTWMGAITSKFNAGIVLQQATVLNISEAILKIKEHYAYYHANAQQAAKYLSITHDPKHTLQAVYDYL